MSRFNKPLPGTPFNYAHPLCPLSRNGAVLTLAEGSGRPRLHLAIQQYTSATTTTERLCTFTDMGWSGYSSGRFAGPTIHKTNTNGLLDCGIHTDFLGLDGGTVVFGFRKVDANDRSVMSTGTNTLAQLFRFALFGSTGTAELIWGGTTPGTDYLTSSSGLVFGEDVWAISVGPRGMEIYQNGRLVGSNTATPTRTASTHSLQLGVHAFFGVSDAGEYSFAYFYPGQLARDDIRYLCIDPFCFYDWGEDEPLSLAIIPGTASLTLTTFAPTVTGSTTFSTAKLIEIDWNADGDYGDTGEDVSARVDGDAGIAWTRGKDQIRQFAPGAAGQLGFLLNNFSRDYSPGNGSSPIAGLVTPGKPVRLSSTSPGRVLWTGITDEINQLPHFTERNVSFNCLGNLAKLRGKYVSTALYSNILTSTFLGHVLDAAGFPAADRTILTGQTTLQWAWADKQDAFDLVMRITRTEGPRASCYESPTGKLVFENRDARITQSRSVTSQQAFTGTANIMDLAYNPNYKDVVEACVIQVDEREVQGQSVIWELGSTLVLGNNAVWRREIRSTSSDPFTDLVVPSPAPSDTVQTLTADAVLTAGTFVLQFRNVATAALDWDSTAAEIQTALEGLSTIGSGNVACAGGPINTTPVTVTFIGTFAGQAITDLIEVLNSTLNPVSAPASITVTEDLAGTGILAERQSLRPSSPLTGGGPFTITVDLSPDAGGGTTGNIAYNATSGTVQTALRALFNCNLFNVINGPLSDGTPFQVIMVTGSAADYPLMTIGGTAVTGSVPSANITVAITVQGGVPDYVVIAGAVTFTLSRTSGANAMLTATAGASGATITGLRVRGRLVTVVRSHQTSFPEDVTDIPAGKIFRADILPEIDLDYAQEYAEAFVDHYSVVRPTVVLTVISSLFSASNDTLYSREISDRVTIVETQTGISNDAHIEQIRQSIAGLVLTTEIGCELIP